MPLGQQNRSFICKFPMPYNKSAQCLVRNDSSSTVKLTYGTAGNKQNNEGFHNLFHAKWNATTKNATPFSMINIKGKGHYVGCFLSAIGQDGTWNILEGDECIMPDIGVQEKQSGTGLEDYFSGAYYYTTLMDLPLHGLIEKGAMRTDQYRFLLLDDVVFNKSFDVSIEFGHANAASGYMSSVIYFYMTHPISQAIPSYKESLLSRPADRFELPGLMSSLFMLEREHLYQNAAERMAFFYQRYNNYPWAELLKIREVGYKEIIEGFDAVQDQYIELTKSSYPAAAQTAKDRIWLHKSTSNALLGIHALGEYKLFLDGKIIAQGTGKNDLSVQRLTLPDEDHESEHVWEVELTPTYQGSFFSLCLQTSEGQNNMNGAWETVEVSPYPGTEAPETFEAENVLPNMTIWAFNPNGYVNMQSPANGIETWYFWDGKPCVKQVKLRKMQSGFLPKETETQIKERSEQELRAHAVN